MNHSPINEIRDSIRAFGPCTIAKLAYQVKLQCDIGSKSPVDVVNGILLLPEFYVESVVDGEQFWNCK